MARKKTDDELKALAMDIVDGKVFTDQMLTSGVDIPMVFMPIILGGLKELTEEEKKDVAMIYEYLDKAGPRSINGNPCFFSLRILFREDFEVMYKFAKEYEELKKNFTNPSQAEGGI